MAEFVGYRQERTLPEYEQMRKRQICTEEEVRTIMKTRDSFEYKIAQQTKSIKDYCRYIAYERNLISMIEEREKNRNTQKSSSLELSIANHIKSLYKEALNLYPQETRLWDNFIKFCKQFKFISDVSSAFEKMLMFHGEKPSVWLRAITWEYEKIHNMERVKDLSLRGLQKHPGSLDLHLNFFKIMLIEASNMSTELNLQNNTESEQSLGLERVVVIYKSSKNKVHNIDYLVKLLEITEEFPFTKSLQKLLIEDMMSAFSRDEMMWHTLAQRELKGFHTCDLTNSESKTAPPDNEKDSTNNNVPKDRQEGLQTKTLKRRIELCFEVYQTAVKELKTEKMWSLFVNAMLELNQNKTTLQVSRRKKLSAAFKGAHEANCMSEEHYCSYIELLRETETDEEFFLEVVKKATSIYPNSVKLWELWMLYHIVANQEDKVYEVFRKVTKKLASEAYPLWRIILQYYQTRFDLPHKVEEIFSQAIKQTAKSFLSFRVHYLEWNSINATIYQSRKLYHELVQLPPPCLELHERMALLESQQVRLRPDIVEWRKCHEYAAHYFGKQRTDVWINYIKFERDHGDPKNMTILFDRAKKALDTDLVDNFISEHCLLTTGIM